MDIWRKTLNNFPLITELQSMKFSRTKLSGNEYYYCNDKLFLEYSR